MNEWIGNGMEEVIDILQSPGEIRKLKSMAVDYSCGSLRTGLDLSCTWIALIRTFDFHFGWYTRMNVYWALTCECYRLEWAANTYNCLFGVLWFFRCSTDSSGQAGSHSKYGPRTMQWIICGAEIIWKWKQNNVWGSGAVGERNCF